MMSLGQAQVEERRMNRRHEHERMVLRRYVRNLRRYEHAVQHFGYERVHNTRIPHLMWCFQIAVEGL